MLNYFKKFIKGIIDFDHSNFKLESSVAKNYLANNRIDFIRFWFVPFYLVSVQISQIRQCSLFFFETGWYITFSLRLQFCMLNYFYSVLSSRFSMDQSIS